MSITLLKKTAGCVLILFSMVLAITNATAAKVVPITVQLNWKHQFEYAAFYAAIDQGYYRDVGLSVTLREGGPGIHAVDEVNAGYADFGIANSSLLIERYRGKPVIALAALMQHSAIMLLARRDQGIENVMDLENKPIAIGAHTRDEILAFLLASGLRQERIQFMEHPGWDASSLATADFFAREIYETNERYWIRGHEHDYILFTPRSEGIDLFGDILFTTEAFINQKPDITQRFRQATLKGLSYAYKHKDQLTELILQRYNTQYKTREHLLFEADYLEKLTRLDLVEPGYMSPDRWQHVHSIYASLGLLPNDFNFDGFIYRIPEAQGLPIWVLWSIGGGLLSLTVMLIITGYFKHLNHCLQQEITERIDAEKRLKQKQEDFCTFVEQANQLLSHELKTPLAIININLQNLEIKNAVPASGQRNIKAIQMATRRLQDVVSNNLKQLFATAHMASNRQLLDFTAALKNNIAEFENLQVTQQIQWTSTDVKPLMVFIAPDMLKTVVFNVLDNALKYAKENSDIRVQLLEQEQTVQLSISNYSCIPLPADLEQLFKPKARGAAPEHIRGAGMGLYLVQLIVDAHGGHISIDSTEPELITINLTLPLAQNHNNYHDTNHLD